MPAESSIDFQQTLRNHGLQLKRTRPETLQLNVGRICNLACMHCHVNAGPNRKEMMDRPTIDRILAWLRQTEIPTVDLTGGAPEMIPDFRYLVRQLRALSPQRHIIDRSNLTILLEPEYHDLAQFLAAHRVEIIASLPCYLLENVDAQRGTGVFDGSIRALHLLNRLGYGTCEELPLHLVYNPVGAHLPPCQEELELDYKKELGERYGIVFHRLFTITNMPVARYASYLRHSGQMESYMRLLAESFNPSTVPDLMCRNTINVGWQGQVYDCDFNQMLNMQWRNGKPLYLWDIHPHRLEGQPILTGSHCFGCTAGAGSSCGGALS